MSYIKFEMPVKDKNNTKRRKGKDKKKNTFKKYGKNTSRGLRIKQAEQEKRVVVNPMAIKIKTVGKK